MSAHPRLRAAIVSALQFFVLFAIISTAVDFWRKPSQPAEFARQTFATVSGGAVNPMQASENQLLVLYFWGSWCGICHRTSPAAERLYQNGIPVLGIALRSGDDPTVRQYMQQHGMSFPSLNDPQGILSRQWQIKVTPTIIVMKNGKIIHNTSGISSYTGLRTRLWLLDQFY